MPTAQNETHLFSDLPQVLLSVSSSAKGKVFVKKTWEVQMENEGKGRRVAPDQIEFYDI